MKSQAMSVDVGGTCAASLITIVPQHVQRVQRDVQPRARSRSTSVAKPPAEDFAPWVMRFLALALVLFVLVVLALHG